MPTGSTTFCLSIFNLGCRCDTAWRYPGLLITPLNINQIILSKYYEIDHYHIEDKCINDVMFESIWEIVDADLSEKNAYILRQIYEEGRSLTSLSKELGIGVERVRQRKIRSLNRLRENVVLRGIYYAYFY